MSDEIENDKEMDNMRDYYDLVGEAVVKEMSSGPIGFDFSALANPLASVAQTAVQQHQADEAKSKAAHDSQAALDSSVSADAQWAQAEANLEMSKVDPTAYAAAKVVCDSARQSAMQAGAALQGDGVPKRCKAAQSALEKAAEAAEGDPKNKSKQAQMHGWQTVAASCGSGGGGGSGTPDAAIVKYHGGHGGSFLTSVHGGLPVWGWGLVGVGSLTVLGLLIHAMRKK